MSGRDEELLRSLAARIDPNDAGAHNNMGVVFYQKGLVDEAIQAFERALEIDPRLEVARSNIQAAFQESGQFEQRIKGLQDGIQRNPGDIAIRDALARTYLLGGKPDEAAREWAALLRDRPQSATLHTKLAFAEAERGNLDKALSLLENALDLAADMPGLHFQRAELLYQAGDLDGSVAAARRALELDDDSARVHLLLANVLEDLGWGAEAVSERDQALRLDPGLVQGEQHLSLERYRSTNGAEPDQAAPKPKAVRAWLDHVARATELRRDGRLDDAAEELERALEASDDAFEARQALAEVRLLQGQPETAATLYQRLLDEEDESPKLWNERGVALHRMGRLVEAVSAYRHAVATDHTYGLGWNNLGVARTQLGEHGAAERALRKAADEASVPEVLWNLGLYLNLHGQMGEAVEVFASAVKLDKTVAESWNRLGGVLFQSDRPEEAKRALERALELDPDLAEARYQLGFALSALGDFKAALRQTKQAMEQESIFPAPRYQLLIDVQFEEGTIPAPEPDIAERVETGQPIQSFELETEALDQAFAQFGEPEIADPAEVENMVAEAEKAIRRGRLERAADRAARAVSMAPAEPGPRLLQARIYLQQGLAGEALERYVQILERGTGDHAAEAAEGRVRALLELRRSREAVPAAEAAVALGAPRALLGKALLQAGDAESAVEVFQSLVEAGDLRPDTLRYYAQALVDMGRPADAEPIFRQALSAVPNVATQVGLARSLQLQGNRDDAETVYMDALKVLPSYGPAAMGLTELRWRQGRQDEAIRTLAAFLEMVPGHVDALIRLGLWLQDTGHVAKATQALERAVRLDPSNGRAQNALKHIHDWGD